MTRCSFLLSLALSSAWNRRATLCLVVFSIALSTALLLGMERVRTQVRDNFVQAVSGTDLVVGARGSELQLLLYAVFHMGKATNNMDWQSAQRIAQRNDVAWTIPVSLGDSTKVLPWWALRRIFLPAISTAAMPPCSLRRASSLKVFLM